MASPPGLWSDDPAAPKSKSSEWAATTSCSGGCTGGSVGLPTLQRGENAYRIEVVAPVRHFAILQFDYRDISVAVWVARRDDLALGCVFEYDRGGRVRPVHAQVVAAVEEERGAVASIKLDQAVTADYVPRVVGNSDDEVEDNVISEKV